MQNREAIGELDSQREAPKSEVSAAAGIGEARENVAVTRELALSPADIRQADSGYTTNSPDTPASSTHARTAQSAVFRFTPSPLAAAAAAATDDADDEYQDQDYENNNTDDDVINEEDIEDEVFLSEAVAVPPPGVVTFPRSPIRVPALYPGYREAGRRMRVEALATPTRVYTVSSGGGPRFSTGSAPQPRPSTPCRSHRTASVGTQTALGNEPGRQLSVSMAGLSLRAVSPQRHLRVLQAARHYSLDASSTAASAAAVTSHPARARSAHARRSSPLAAVEQEPDRARSEPSLRQQMERQFGRELRRISDEFHHSYQNLEQPSLPPRPRSNGYVRHNGRASVDVLQARRASQHAWWQRIIQLIAPRANTQEQHPVGAGATAGPVVTPPVTSHLLLPAADSNGETARCDDEVDGYMSRYVRRGAARHVVPGERVVLDDEEAELQQQNSDPSTLGDYVTAAADDDTDIDENLPSDS